MTCHCCCSSGRGRCLENKPQARRFVMPAILPGQYHDSAAQCRFQFGSSSVICNKTAASHINVTFMIMIIIIYLCKLNSYKAGLSGIGYELC